jgi:Flp pilus assembly protein TadD
VCRDQRRYEEAEKFLRRAIQIDKDNEGALSNLAHVLEQIGRGDEAFEYSMRAREILDRLSD